MHLAERRRGVGRVVQDARRVDDVEAVVRERQVLRVGNLEIGAQVLRFEAPLRPLDGPWREVDAGEPSGPASRPADMVKTHADANLEHILVPALREPSEVEDIGLKLVARLLVRSELFT